MRFASALVIFAHPDDAEYMCGGTVALWAGEGTEVHYCVITDGSAGSNEPGVVREVIKGIIEREGPLSREDIIERVKRERYVKDATISVNLQNNMFTRLSDGRYSLAK